MRVADEDRQMSARELETLILRQNRAAMRWDNEPTPLTVDSLDEKRIRQFVQTAGLTWDNATNALEKLGLLRDGAPVNTARLFFTDEPIELRCAVFATQTSSTIIDRHDFHGTLLELIEEAQKFILKNIHIGMRLDGMRRVDVPEIAIPARREAIINAFCHRDWRDPDYVQVAIYRDRVEIRNPGELYENLTLEELRRGGVSRRRNPLIADMLRRIHLVEAWGRGVPLILENAPDVSFHEVAGLFVARFTRPSAQEAAPETTARAVPETVPETSPELRGNGSVPARTQKGEVLLQLLRNQPRLTIPELAHLTGLSGQGVKYNLDRLKQAGRLKRHGPTKGGYWEVADADATD